MIKTIIRDILVFLKKPDDSQIDLRLKNKIYTLLGLLLVNGIISYGVIVPLLNRISEIIPLEYADVSDFTKLQVFLLMVLLIPFIEELVFRYYLRYKGLKTSIISITRWRKIFPALVYCSAILFALLHLSNYSSTNILFFLFSPVIVLSQFLTGLMTTYLRVRFDFIWGLLFHWLWNFLAFYFN